MHDPTTLIFAFTGLSAVVPYELLEGQAPLLRLSFLEDPIHDCLARLWCSLASILSDSPFLVFCQRLRSVFYGRYRACFPGVSLVFFGALPENIMGSPLHAFLCIFFFGKIIFSGRAPWPLKPLGTSILVLDRVVSLTSFPPPTWRTAWSTKADQRTWQDWYYWCRDLFWSLDQMHRSWKISALLLFYWQLSLVLSLLGIGVGEEIKF